jgi:hypothetical protein
MSRDPAIEPDRSAAEIPAASVGPALFTWTAWGASLVLALVYVGAFGRNVPVVDEWEMVVPFLTGDRPLSFESLWAQHNEHRIVLTRLVELSLIRLGGGDFRVGMYFNVAVCALVAAALVRAARQLRGRPAYQDAVLPILLLQVSHYETFTRGDTVGNVLGTALACAWLLVILRGRAATATHRAALAGACLLLPLCGGNGLCLIPALSAWLVYAGIADLRDPARAGRLAGLLELIMVSILYIIIYLYSIGYHAPPHPRSPGFASVLRMGLEVLSAGLGGPAARSTWPYLGAAVLLLLLLVAGALVSAAWRCRSERLRALGLLLFLGGFASLALAVGWGRSGYGPLAGFHSRYALLAAPALCGAYLAWEAYAPRGWAGFVGAMISTLACMCYVPNLEMAWPSGAAQRDALDAFERDVKAGAPPQRIARQHYSPRVFSAQWKDVLAPRVNNLRSRNIHQFRQEQLRPVVPLRIQPAELHDVIWNDGACKATGHDPYMVFRFRKPQYAWGIRLTCTYEGRRDEPATFQAFWKLSGRNDFSERERTTIITIAEKEKKIILPIDDVIDSFRIDPDTRPGAFRISRLELMREPDPPATAPGFR